MTPAFHTLVLNFGDIQGDPMEGAIAYVSYDRDVRSSDGTLIPSPAATGIAIEAITEATVQVVASDDPNLMADSQGFGIRVRLVWTEAPDWRQQSKSWMAQVTSSDADIVNLSGVVGAQPVPPQYADASEVLAIATDSKNAAQSSASSAATSADAATTAQAAADSAQSDAAASASAAAASAALVGAPAGDAIDAHLGAMPMNVVVQGAVADGTTDDTTAIQGTLNSAATFGVRRVTIPSGSYAHGALTIPSGVTLAGEEGATLIPNASTTTFLATATNAENVVLDGLTIDLGGNVSSYGIQVSTGTKKFTMRNCTVTDAWTATAVIETRDGTTDITIENNTFDGCLDTVRVNKNPTRVRVLRNLFTNWKGRPIYLLGSTGYAASNVEISGNTIINPASMATSDTRQPICISGVDTDPFYRVHIKDNTIVGNGNSFTDTTTPGMADLISLHQCIDFEVSGNTLIDGGDGRNHCRVAVRQGYGHRQRD